MARFLVMVVREYDAPTAEEAADIARESESRYEGPFFVTVIPDLSGE